MALAPGIWTHPRGDTLASGGRTGKATGKRGQGSRGRATHSRPAGRVLGGSGQFGARGAPCGTVRDGEAWRA